MLKSILGWASAVVVAAMGTAGAAPYENGVKATPGIRMPVGQYECSQGSYKYKPCTVTEEEGNFYLTVTEGARFPFKAQLMATDEKGQLVLLGKLTTPGELCPTCADDALGKECAGDLVEKQACPEQPIHASMRKGGNGIWTGDLLFYLVRGVDGVPANGFYRLGITDTFRIRPAR